ncbi:coiled-coil domain-containing protein 170-like [Ylistrum balloti]|uniref:coiled-coil domain-containing protein 170-like n=1 Tax=Ylistrum balloti TaxID=509963 RepID=UPI002905ECA3|nr:coiled-coil domain-containing protein 170-like [Ylistrum balloti]
MASYLKDVEHGLPTIRRTGLLESTSSPHRITTVETDVLHRYSSPIATTTTYTTEPLINPRPPSPSQRRAVSDLTDQVKTFKEELRKKDALIQQLVSMESVPKVTVRSGADAYRHDAIFMGDRHAIDTARGEAATLQVKNEKLQAHITDLKTDLEAKEIKIKELKTLYDTSKENEHHLTTLLESHRQQIMELEGKAGSYETAVGRSEFTVSALQQQIREGQEKILELESRLRTHLDDREAAEVKCQSASKRYDELLTQITGLLQVESIQSALGPEDILRRLTDLVQENAILKGKIITMSECLNSTELETKASRETIMRLVSEVGKEQKCATRYTTEIDNLRMERDEALSSKHGLEREIELLKERLEASHKSVEAARRELELRESRITSLDREYRSHHHDVHVITTQLSTFKEKLAAILSTADLRLDMSEETLVTRINTLIQENCEFINRNESLQERVKTLTEQLESQYELHKSAAARARKAEVDLAEYDSRLRSAEGELTAGDVLRDNMRGDKEKYLRCLQQLGEVMKMERISNDLGLDMTIEALMARADQLVKMEKDALIDKSTHIYNLQRKIKSLKEQLESKDLHVDLLRKKMTGLEEKIMGKTEIEKERDGETYRVRKLEKIVEKYKLQNQDLRHEITNLKANLLGSSEMKIRTLEQRKEIEELSAQVEELEKLRSRQAHKISKLKSSVDLQESESQEKRVIADNAVHALSSELRTTKNALIAIQNREKQLLDFRGVVSRMLGLDLSTLAVPDYEIISRLEKLIQAHHNHTFTTMSMEEALADMEDGFLSGFEEYRSRAVPPQSTIGRSRERARRKAARARARSVSPQRRDHRVY